MGSSSSSAMSTSQTNLVEAGETRVLRRPIFKYVKHFRTFIGMITVVIVFLAAIDALVSISRIPLGIYLAVVDCPLFLLEAGKLIKTLCGTDGICCRAFSLVLSFDKKKRGLLYIAFSILCFANFLAPSTYAYVAGGFLVASGVLYLIKDQEYKKVKTYRSDAASAVQSARENP